MKIHFKDAEITVEATVERGICENHADETERPGYRFSYGDHDDFLCRMCFEDPRSQGTYEILSA